MNKFSSQCSQLFCPAANVHLSSCFKVCTCIESLKRESLNKIIKCDSNNTSRHTEANMKLKEQIIQWYKQQKNARITWLAETAPLVQRTGPFRSSVLFSRRWRQEWQVGSQSCSNKLRSFQRILYPHIFSYLLLVGHNVNFFSAILARNRVFKKPTWHRMQDWR